MEIVEWSIECPFCDLVTAAVSPSLAVAGLAVHFAEHVSDMEQHSWPIDAPLGIVIVGRHMETNATDAAIAWSQRSGRIGPYNPLSDDEVHGS